MIGIVKASGEKYEAFSLEKQFLSAADPECKSIYCLQSFLVCLFVGLFVCYGLTLTMCSRNRLNGKLYCNLHFLAGYKILDPRSSKFSSLFTR